MATAMVQMNTRIGADEKAAGDKALREAGFTPSAAIRALWNKAACGGEDLQKIVDLLSSSSSPARASGPALSNDFSMTSGPSSTGAASLVRGRELVPTFFAELGITPGAPAEGTPDTMQITGTSPFDKEIEAALVERYKERGLL